ncbi:outer membrane protein [Luteolibacter marinus]|uniref:outer membrane protein n=1 Tax=Luteolibacter marinus TaxID=2776705 RepID=UPI001866AA7D|nr:hypothetical protein [Luteolibacter marinus]
MRSLRLIPPCFTATSLLVGLLGSATPSYSQDFSLQVGEGDRVLSDAFFPPTLAQGVKGGVYFGLEGLVTYDSNFFLDADYTESELTTEIAPWIAYRTDPEGNAEFSLEARYSPTARVFLNHSDLNGIDHAGEVSFRYQASKTTVTAYASYSEVSSSDRIAGGFIQGSILTYGIAGSYQLAPRTSILAGWSASSSDYSSGGRAGADVYTSEISGLWDATERIRFGPSIRHTLTDSASTGERDAIGVLAKARYRWGERIRIDAFAGVEFAKNSRTGGGRDAGPAGGLAAEYFYNERWSFRGGVRYATVPSPNNVNYLVNDLTFSMAVVRNFETSSLEFGAGLSFTDYEAVGATAATRGDERFYSTYLGYRRQLFNERVSLESIVRWATNDGQKDWSQWQLSTGIEVEF